VTRPFDILATKGSYPAAPTELSKQGRWYMDHDGWRQHGTDAFERYDKHKVAVVCGPAINGARRLSATLGKIVALGLFPVCVAVWMGWL
jgi:hypothetical protein